MVFCCNVRIVYVTKDHAPQVPVWTANVTTPRADFSAPVMSVTPESLVMNVSANIALTLILIMSACKLIRLLIRYDACAVFYAGASMNSTIMLQHCWFFSRCSWRRTWSYPDAGESDRRRFSKRHNGMGCYRRLHSSAADRRHYGHRRHQKATNHSSEVAASTIECRIRSQRRIRRQCRIGVQCRIEHVKDADDRRGVRRYWDDTRKLFHLQGNVLIA